VHRHPESRKLAIAYRSVQVQGWRQKHD
jgi:hypothetical protein